MSADLDLSDLRGRLQGLTETERQYLVLRVAREKEARRTLWQCQYPSCTGKPHKDAPAPHARKAQRWPFRKDDGYWGALIMAGRGFGKSRAASEWVRWAVEHGYKRIGVVARTGADARDTMVEGESGILAVWPSWQKPVYEASKRRVTFYNPDGTERARATMYSAERPDQLRGPQHDLLIADEFGAYGTKAEEVLSNGLFGLRLKTGAYGPRMIFATTPKNTKAMRDLIKRPGLLIIRGSTRDNLSNLSDTFADAVLAQYEGTRVGRQEIDGELLTDVEGALLEHEVFDRDGFRVAPEDMPELRKIVVAVDPAVTSSTKSDHTGVCVVGLGVNGHAYVLASWALKDSPAECMRFAIRQYHTWGANAIVPEVNNGGDYVRTVIEQLDRTVVVDQVRASVGKTARAEPVAMLYQQGRVHHVGPHTQYAALEDLWTSWVPEDEDSPDELDACVWGVTKLMLAASSQEAPYKRKRR